MHPVRSLRLGKVVASTPRGAANTPKHARRSQNAIKRLAIVAISVLAASIAAVGVSTMDPKPAQAAGGGYVAKCGGGKIFLNEKEKKTFYLHNSARKDHSLKPFCVHPALQKAARDHSKDMIRRDYFSHNTLGKNESACERIKRYGYNWRICGENIAGGPGSYGAPGPIFQGWMNSDYHRKNILNGKFREIGIGTYTGNYKGTSGYTMYTVDFGTR